MTVTFWRNAQRNQEAVTRDVSSVQLGTVYCENSPSSDLSPCSLAFKNKASLHLATLSGQTRSSLFHTSVAKPISPDRGPPPSAMSLSTSNPDYFAAYLTFNPEPYLPLLENFNRLAKAQGWRKKRREEERQAFLLGQYTIHLGGISTGKLQKWQELCGELGVDPIPTSITQCKKVRGIPFLSLFVCFEFKERKKPNGACSQIGPQEGNSCQYH